MRISDWSSDVCSSDLPEAAEALRNLIRLDVAVVILARPHEFAVPFERARDHVVDQALLIFDAGFGEFAFEFTVEYFLKQILEAADIVLQDGVLGRQIDRPVDRKIVWKGKSVSGRLDLGGRR